MLHPRIGRSLVQDHSKLFDPLWSKQVESGQKPRYSGLSEVKRNVGFRIH